MTHCLKRSEVKLTFFNLVGFVKTTYNNLQQWDNFGHWLSATKKK
jgi:hypothetical protein